MAKEIVVLCGIPNSGKSTYASYMQEIYFYKIICRDSYRELTLRKGEKYGDYVFNKENEEEITRRVNFFFDLYTAQGHDVIIDQTNCKDKYIQEWIRRKPRVIVTSS